MKEALRSDGTSFDVLSDSAISGGALLDTNGMPAYPILISLASEAISDAEIGRLTNYVAAGGFLFVGSSAFTRFPDGTTRGDFALGQQMGMHMVTPDLPNWTNDVNLTKVIDHRLIAHLPGGPLLWQMPVAAEEVSGGISPAHSSVGGHPVWQVHSADATILAQGDVYPYLVVKPYGKGWFIYYAAMQPLIGHGGQAPGMYAYVIFRRAIEWAFESAKLAIPKLSPWPFPYDAAFMARHELGNNQVSISNIVADAQFQAASGAHGDYYFSTGTLRDEMTNSPAIIASLRQAVANYGANIGAQNGGLPNPDNQSILPGNPDYWGWGPDEALDLSGTNVPLPYPDGFSYALASVSNSLADIEGWMTGVTNGPRVSSAPYFNATRERSCEIEEQLNVRAVSDVKLSAFPSWVHSTALATEGRSYSFVSLPVNDWFISAYNYQGYHIAQSLESVPSDSDIGSIVNFYYGLGALINLNSHTLITDSWPAGGLAQIYTGYALNPALHPRLWSVNSAGLYSWWLQRSNAQVTATSTSVGDNATLTLHVSGASDPQTAVELVIPGGAYSGLQVRTNGTLASTDFYRANGQVVKVLVGTSVTNVQVSYLLHPIAQNDGYSLVSGNVLTVPPAGILGNDFPGAGTNLTPVLVNGPGHGSLTLNADGGFTYTPAAAFNGVDTFLYQASDGITSSTPAAVTLDVAPTGSFFFDNFSRCAGADPLAPWTVALGNYSISNGVMHGTGSTVGYTDAYVPGNWGDCSVQARIQLPIGGWAGGIEGRLNPLTGEKYTANIYPETSPGSAVVHIQLMKFRLWTQFAELARTPLVSVGTNWHTMKLTFQGNRIRVFFDGTQMLDVTDNGQFDGRPAYTSGGIGAHLFGSGATFDDFLVTPYPSGPIASNSIYSLPENNPLVVPAPGILSDDTPGVGTNLAAVLVSGPTNGVLTLNADGSFTYVPNTNFIGTDSFTYEANDGVTNSAHAIVVLSVVPEQPPQAFNDSYSVVQGQTLHVAAPGVLANDTNIYGHPMTALLASGPGSGTLVLSNDGSFAYTSAPNFVGTDSFTYLANDGVTNSTPATVTIQVRAVQAPVANNDFFTLPQNVTSVVPAPGVLGNDTDSNNLPLSASVSSNPSYGALAMNANGSFSYTPAGNFAGIDSFTYVASDALSNSTPALAVLDITPPGVLFMDNFTRPISPSPLTPWIAADGNWTMGNGVLQSSNSPNYSDAYVPGNWSDYTLQGRLQFPPSGWTAGFSGRLNPLTGAKYTVAIFPESTPEIPLRMRLMKFSNWTTWNTLAEVPLPAGVGTNWHTLTVRFSGNEIRGYFDRVQVLDATDTGSGGVPAYTNGAIGAFQFVDGANFDDVRVIGLGAGPTVSGLAYNLVENSSLHLADPGILVVDTPGLGTNLTAVLLSGPTNGTLVLNAAGGFSYTPATNFVGTDSFTYEANDGVTSSIPATVTFSIVPANQATNSVLTVTAAGSSRVYGAANGTLTGTLTGLQPGDSISAHYTTTATNRSPAGSYPIIPVLEDPGVQLGNYTLVVQNSALIVTQAVLTVSATAQNRVYDGTTVAGVALSDNRLSGDNLTTSYTQASFADKLVGTNKPVTVSGISVTGPDAANYTYNTTATTAASITSAALLVTAIGQDRIYDGTTNATVSLSDNRIAGDALTLNYAQASFADKQVGTNKPVSVTGISVTGVDAGNYTFNTAANTTAAILQAVLSVTADNQTRPYLANNPTFTAHYSGFVNGETLASSGVTGAPGFSTTATQSSPPGNYPIVVTNGTLSAVNYSFHFVNGTLTVLNQQLTILSITGAGTANVVLRWSAVSNATYRVQFRSNLSSGSWVDLSPDVTATNNVATATDHPAGAPRRFYRVRLLP
jgi:hypothetical protein